jgi:hypothetical protein
MFPHRKGVQSSLVPLSSLVHREEGRLSTYMTEDQAQRELKAVLRDEPGWVDDVWIEQFEFVVQAHD